MNKKYTFQVCFLVFFLLGINDNPIFGQSLPRPQFETKECVSLHGPINMASKIMISLNISSDSKKIFIKQPKSFSII
jgi:hypothetical protein